MTGADAPLNRLAAEIENGRAPDARRLIAIAGAPGSGKSTLSAALCDHLNADDPTRAAVVPMDGFHFDDGLLSQHGTLARKGAPFTFDVGGLLATLRRLRANDEAQITVPVFDRALEISRAGARQIARDTPILLVEGNYLLVDQDPWSDLRPLFDLTIALSVPMAELERRLIQRWRDHGHTAEQARERARANDLVNAQFVKDHGLAADIVVPFPDPA